MRQCNGRSPSPCHRSAPRRRRAPRRIAPLLPLALAACATAAPPVDLPSRSDAAVERAVVLQCASAALAAAYIGQDSPLAPMLDDDAGLWITLAFDGHAVTAPELVAVAATLLETGTVARTLRLCIGEA